MSSVRPYVDLFIFSTSSEPLRSQITTHHKWLSMGLEEVVSYQCTNIYNDCPMASYLADKMLISFTDLALQTFHSESKSKMAIMVSDCQKYFTIACQVTSIYRNIPLKVCCYLSKKLETQDDQFDRWWSLICCCIFFYFCPGTNSFYVAIPVRIGPTEVFQKCYNISEQSRYPLWLHCILTICDIIV